MSEPASVLRRVPIVSALDEADIAALEKLARRRRYKRGEVIFHRDDEGTTFYTVLSGWVRIYTSSDSGDEVTLALLGTGEFFGELSLLDGEPRSATAQAVEDCETLVLHRTDLHAFLESRPKAAIAMLGVLSQRLRRTDQLVEDAAFLDIPARLAKRILELVESHGIQTPAGWQIDARFTHADLAAMVGSTRVSITKALKQYSDAGYITIDDRHIVVRKMEALRRRAR
ncbi:MAG: Crp/Fnr family transcriptional regulator [Chloroflexi bacterium]|nr:Crp/Fnr family transcriptional regulator [Chloroflexota bacterium]